MSPTGNHSSVFSLFNIRMRESASEHCHIIFGFAWTSLVSYLFVLIKQRWSGYLLIFHVADHPCGYTLMFNILKTFLAPRAPPECSLVLRERQCIGAVLSRQTKVSIYTSNTYKYKDINITPQNKHHMCSIQMSTAAILSNWDGHVMLKDLSVGLLTVRRSCICCNRWL